MKLQMRYDVLTVTRILYRMINGVSLLMFFLSLLVAGYEVIMRLIFHSSHDWGEEIVITLMLYGVFLGAVMALREGKHTRVNMLLPRLSSKNSIKCEILITTITMITCGAYAWSGVKIVIFFYQRGLISSSSLEMPYWIRYIVLPISLWLCTLVGIERIAVLFAKFKSLRG